MKKVALALVGALVLLLCVWKLQRAESQFLAEANLPAPAPVNLPAQPVAQPQPAGDRLASLRKRSTEQIQKLLASLKNGTASHDWTRDELIEVLAERGLATPAK